jgi:hypothetical protein
MKEKSESKENKKQKKGEKITTKNPNPQKKKTDFEFWCTKWKYLVLTYNHPM